MNILELAKECGFHKLPTARNDYLNCATDDQLTAFANAIVEECAKVALTQLRKNIDSDDYIIGCGEAADAIRALKVKG